MNILSDLYLLSHLFSGLTSIAIVIPTFRIYLHTKINMILLMTSLGLTWGVVHLFTILPFFTRYFTTNIIGAVFSVGTMTVICFIVLFMDIFDGSLSVKKSVFVFSGLSSVFFLVLAGILNDTPAIYTKTITIPGTEYNSFLFSPLIAIIIFISALLGGIWIFLTLKNSLKLAVDSRQIRQLKLMRLGILFLVFTSVVFAIPGVLFGYINEITYSILFSQILSFIAFSIGLTYFTYAYSQSNQIAFLQPQKVETLIVINNAGLPLFRYEFKKQISENDTLLVSGAITAVKALMADAFGVSSDIKGIQFQNKEIVFKINQEIAFVLITEQNSNFLSRALEIFAKSFSKNFNDKIINFKGNTEDFISADVITREIFGFGK